jgi:hypothetical protein
MDDLKRREFIRNTFLAGAGIYLCKKRADI